MNITDTDSLSLPDPLPIILHHITLHDALPILLPRTSSTRAGPRPNSARPRCKSSSYPRIEPSKMVWFKKRTRSEEHTSNSSHVSISYAVFCLKKKKQKKKKNKTKRAKHNMYNL